MSIVPTTTPNSFGILLCYNPLADTLLIIFQNHILIGSRSRHTVPISISALKQTRGWYLVGQNLRAIEANTAHDTEHSLQKSDMKHGLGKLEVPKVARALGHVRCTSVALHLPINGAKPRVA